jgi:hypothetical protein
LERKRRFQKIVERTAIDDTVSCTKCTEDCMIACDGAGMCERGLLTLFGTSGFERYDRLADC